MTYEEIIQSVGKTIRKQIYYYDSDNERVDFNYQDIKSVKIKSNASIVGTYMNSLELVLNDEIDTPNAIYTNIVASYDNNTTIKTYGPYYLKEKATYNADEKTYTHYCYDEMLNTMVDYEAVSINYPCTIQQFFNALVTKLGYTTNVTLVNGSLTMSSDIYTGINYTYRSVLQDIAEANGVLLYIENSQVKVASFDTQRARTIIDDDILKNTNIDFGKHYGPINTIVLSRSGGSDNIYYPLTLPENPIEFKISDNQLMNGNNRSSFMAGIYNKLSGLEFDLFDTELVGYGGFNPLQEIEFQTGDNTYTSYVFNNEIEITDGYNEVIYTEEPIESETNYKAADTTDERINQAYILVDKQNQTIESVVSQTEEQNEKISSISQTVDEINSKISDIADITVSGESQIASVPLTNVNESEPILIKIHPLNQNISYLYPSDNLYPSNDLFMSVRTIRFKNTDTNEYVDYEIPDDLLYYDANHYDDFSLGYDTQTCVVNKKCGYDANGNVVLLDTPRTIECEYPTIALTDGNYEVSLLGYTSAYMYVTLMAKNIYTTQFYTRAETDSKISQKANEITLGVNQTLTNYSTTNEMNSAISIKANEINSVVSQKVGNNEIISKINQTPELISINANKVNLTGYITATDLSGNGTTTINGSNITTGTISTDRLSSNVITTSNLSSQNISANQITTGTLSANRISGGTINADNINVTNLSASNVTKGTLSGVPINYTSNGQSFKLVSNSDDLVMGYRGTSPRWSLASFTAGGRFQTFNSSGTMAAYFNQTGVHGTSDIRLKENISKIEEEISMNIITNLNPIEYTYKEEKDYHRGLSAQEVIDVLNKNDIKNEIYELNNDYYSLNYSEFIPDLINCIKYQQKEIDKLKEEIIKLKESE